MVLGLSVACGGRTLAEDELDGAGGSGVPAGAGGAAATSLDEACRTSCSDEIFNAVASCKLCHGASSKLGGLDLESPGRAARLKNVPAKHIDIALPGAQCPIGDKLIDSANVQQSWLLKKITGAQGTCGEPMPVTGPLLPEQRACLTSWIGCVASH
jgi:hypothetical protein